MIVLKTQVDISGLRPSQVADFMLHCTDAGYQRWWPGVHLAFHTIKRFPGEVGNRVHFDEFVGPHRLKFEAVVVRYIPDREISWQLIKGVRLPAWLILQLEDLPPHGVRITHIIRAGYNGVGRLLDPLLRLHLSAAFEENLNAHAREEFGRLQQVLH